MNKKDIIGQFKTKKNQDRLFELKSGSTVIGEVVDENNHLHYVIQKNDEIDIVDAENQPIVTFFPNQEPVYVTLSGLKKPTK